MFDSDISLFVFEMWTTVSSHLFSRHGFEWFVKIAFIIARKEIM